MGWGISDIYSDSIDIWNLQGFLPVVWNCRQILSNQYRDIAIYRRVAK